LRPQVRSRSHGLCPEALSVLRAESVSFGYDGGFTLTDASVAIAAGSLTGLIGPNGCGKTTLLKLLCGVLRPRTGRVMLGDRVLT
jgi:ABC-type cobalamin/Fe3+-siderophores transport system ATPase subunit